MTLFPSEICIVIFNNLITILQSETNLMNVGFTFSSFRMGREVISKFTSNINSTDKFYTDSNGREIMQRMYVPVVL